MSNTTKSVDDGLRSIIGEMPSYIFEYLELSDELKREWKHGSAAMTTLNNDELRKQILKEGKVSASVWRVTQRMYDDGYVSDFTQTAQQIVEIPIDDLMQLIATHDQQLLEAILEGIVDVYDTRGDTQNGDNPKYWTRRTKAINERNEEIRQHIKSVFQKEGKS